MPGDSNEDNIYEVTVVASDGGEAARRDVIVKITDSDEAGVITLTDVNPLTGQAVMAALTDSDGEVINVKWNWHLLDATQVTALETARNAADPPAAIQTFLDGEDASPAIEGETSDTYTPGADDIGKRLVAVARYIDRTEDTDNTLDTNDNPVPDGTAAPDFIRF